MDVEPGLRAAGPLQSCGLDQQQIDQPLFLQRRRAGWAALGLRRAIAARHLEQPVHLPRHERRPGGLVPFGDVEHVVVDPLDLGEPFGGRGGRLGADGGDLVAQRLDLAFDPLHQRPDRPGPAHGHEAEHRRVAHRSAPRRLAGAQDHQPGQLGHHPAVGVAGLEEHVLGHREDFRITQGVDVGRMRDAGDQGHLARRFARADDAQELRLLAGFAAEGAEASGAHDEQHVGRVALSEQLLAPRHREPDGLRLGARVAEQPRQRRIDRDVRQGRHGQGA